MSRKRKGKIADCLMTLGTMTFFGGLLLGPSPENALDLWTMAAGACMLLAALAFCRKPKARAKHIKRPE